MCTLVSGTLVSGSVLLKSKGTLELWNFLGKKNDRRYRTEQQRVTVVLGNWRSSQNNVL